MNNFLKHLNCACFAIMLVTVSEDLYLDTITKETYYNMFIGSLNFFWFVWYTREEQSEL